MKYNIKQLQQNNLPVCLREFLNYLSTIKGKSPNTIKAYKLDMMMFFRFLKLYKGLSNADEFENVQISDIDDTFLSQIALSDLYAFLSFVEEYRANGSYARARKVATLKSFFKYLSTKAKVINENPAADLESPKIDKRNPVYLTLEESKQLLSAIDSSSSNGIRDHCIITLFLNCGLRISELCSINISKIKTDTLTIIGKGNKERTIYLNSACIKSINDYLVIRSQQLSKSKKPLSLEDKDALFLSRNNRRINKRTIQIMVKKYIKKAGLNKEKCTPHKLRHTAATLMYKYGKVDIRSLQKILGHENISTTQIYTHVDDEKLRQAVNSNPLANIDDN
ncbi:tyrosine recombinase XerC [Haloimpatiens sp. FM7330]|uniref:tyrosine recombinase XerC n=1 Tax=Haloimpatiens sp. FM7330 TaxID=3298610 RepID=UPI00362DE766